MNRFLNLGTIFFVFLFSLFFTLNLGADGPSSKRYRDRFANIPSAPEREEPVGEGKGDGKDDRGTKGGKSGRKKKRDDDVVIPFGLEEKAPSKVFLEIEHGEIIATSYTGFTEHEPAWEPIVWSPLSDSWDRDSLGVSIQRELVEPVENNGILWSPDGHHSSAPEIGQDLGLGDTGVLLIGFAGQLSIQGSARSIIRSIGILRPGAVAVAAGRALSAATRLAPRVGHRVTPVAMISAPSFIILDTAMRPRSGNDCGFCDKRLRDGPFPWSPRTIHEHPSPPPVNPTTSPIPTTTDPGVPPDSTITNPGLPPDADVDGDQDDLSLEDDLTKKINTTDDSIGIYFGPGVYKWYGVKTPQLSSGSEPPNLDDLFRDAEELIQIIEPIVRKALEIIERDGISYTHEWHFDHLVGQIFQVVRRRVGSRYDVYHLLEIIKKILESVLRDQGGSGLPPSPPPGANGILPPFILFPIIGDDERERWREYLGTKKSQPLSVRDYLNLRGSRNAMQHHVSSVY